MKLCVVILTFNSAAQIRNTIQSVRAIGNSAITVSILVVDSFSTDETVSICRELGATVISHEFENYGAQRNWAMENIPQPANHDWELHLDADEACSQALVHEVRVALFSRDISGWFIPRWLAFMGRTIRHGGLSPTWHLRLFRPGVVRCEERKYDQHFVFLEPNSRSGKMKAGVLDTVASDVEDWTSRHLRWAALEVDETVTGHAGLSLRARWLGQPHERRRAMRRIFSSAPLAWRAWMLFVYRYVFRRGFLDGREGLIFYTLQTLWFRIYIDALLIQIETDSTGFD